MTEPLTQDGRLIALETALGKDRLLLTAVTANEALSQPFLYELDAISEDVAIEAKQLVGLEVGIRLGLARGSRRRLHGIVSRFLAGPTRVLGFRGYRIQVVPWLALLSHSTDCRIFQNLSVPEILEEVFQNHGFSDFELRIERGQYPPREYCVQYRETALNFVSRLMEDEGLFYFFEHEEKRHLLVVADSNLAFKPLRIS